MTHICLGETQFYMEVLVSCWSKRIRFRFRHGPTSNESPAKYDLEMEKPWLENSCQRFTMKMEIVWCNYFLGQDFSNFYQHELRHNLGVF